MSSKLEEKDWEDLLSLIDAGKCTPFIGAGASAGTLPSGSTLAKKWADKYDYPLQDTHDLARVAQFLAIHRYEMFPKDTVCREFEKVPPPDFSAPEEPHGMLADLNLPIYITTNYDGFMAQAIAGRHRTPQVEFCRWNKFPEMAGLESAFSGDYKPSIANPLVYHLHGNLAVPQSMVLTEGDYLDFLIRLTSDQALLPPAVRTALAGTSLLFVGYSLTDWNFRVLFRGLIGSLAPTSATPASRCNCLRMI